MDMNKFLIPLFVALCASYVLAQDIIHMKSGNSVEAEIVEKTDEKIRFKKFDNLDGPIYVVKMQKVSSVTYASGATESFEPAPAPIPEAVPEPIPEPVSEPVPEPISEPIEPVAEDAPVAEPVVAPVPEQAPEPEPVVEHVVEPDPEPIEEVPAEKPRVKKKRPVIVEETPDEEDDTYTRPKKKAKKKRTRPVAVEETPDEEDEAEATPKKKAKKKRTRNKVDVSAQAGLNILTYLKQTDRDIEYLLNPISPTVNMELYMFPVTWMGLGGGVGFIYTTITDENFAWLQLREEGTTGSMYIMPVYGSFKFRIGKSANVIPYVKLDLGYAFWWASDEITYPNDGRTVYSWGAYGGFLEGIGGGVEFGFGLNVEWSFSMFTGGIETWYSYGGYRQHHNPEYDFYLFSIMIGYTF